MSKPSAAEKLDVCRSSAQAAFKSLELKKQRSFFGRLIGEKPELYSFDDYITGDYVSETNGSAIARKLKEIVENNFPDQEKTAAEKAAIAMKLLFEVAQDFELKNPYIARNVNTKVLRAIYESFADEIIRESMIAAGRQDDYSRGNISLEYSNQVMFGVFEEIFNAADKEVFSKNNVAIFKTFYRKGNPLFAKEFLSGPDIEGIRMDREIAETRRYIGRALFLPSLEDRRRKGVTTFYMGIGKPEVAERADVFDDKDADWRQHSQAHHDDIKSKKTLRKARRESSISSNQSLTLKDLFVKEFEEENVSRYLDSQSPFIDKFVSHFIGAHNDFCAVKGIEKDSADMANAFFDAVEELIAKGKKFDGKVLAQVYKQIISITTQYGDIADPAIVEKFSEIQTKIDDKKISRVNSAAFIAGKKEYSEAGRPHEGMHPLERKPSKVLRFAVPTTDRDASVI